MSGEVVEYQIKDIVNIEDYAMSIEGLTRQVALIQQVMVNVMRQDEHYGIIPGTDKPTLLKPGAEKLCLTFRLDPGYEIIREERESYFIAYTVKCTLSHIPTGQRISSGIGSCNSRETKYRYRSENTGKEVPGEYWKSRDTNLLGGPQYKPRKKDGKWVIFEQVENDNPWDLDNTLIKMACKRALVAATLNATAASDIFTQDVEDMPPEILGTGSGTVGKKAEKKDSTVKRKSESDKGGVPTAKIRAINAMLSKAGVKDDQQHTFVSSIIGRKVEALNNLTDTEASTVIDRLQEKKEDPPAVRVPKDCPKDPNKCEHSGWADDGGALVPFCGPDGEKCEFWESK